MVAAVLAASDGRDEDDPRQEHVRCIAEVAARSRRRLIGCFRNRPIRTSRRLGGGCGMRTKIKNAATELLIKHGYRGLRFGDIAARLGTTRANIHYHFGNKQKLVEEVLDDYVAHTLERFQRVWTDGETRFSDKIRGTAAFNHERYRRFNGDGEDGNPWSLIARMRLDADALSETANARLRIFGVKLHADISAAVEAAKRNGELRADAPVEEITLQLMSITNFSAGPVTQDAGGFERLEQLYLAFSRTVTQAYGSGAEGAGSVDPAPPVIARTV